ncbi:Unknown protein [Striga hermonthica]|uniref:BED-type domain-containing protein n=1 Tax=Striga hermonthica TaxID=68872 RepID=A0A9N7N7A4_STRHE|nr:Unknown protein [Striga hermonthica]
MKRALMDFQLRITRKLLPRRISQRFPIFPEGNKSSAVRVFVHGFDRNGGEDQIMSSWKDHLGSCGDNARISIRQDPDATHHSCHPPSAAADPCHPPPPPPHQAPGMESQSVSSSNPALSTNVNVIEMKDGDNQTQEISRNTNVSQKSNPKKRKERSIAWDHCVRKIIHDDEGNEEMFAICKHCELQMPADSKRNGTRGLLNHLYYRCESSPLRVVMDKSQPTLTQSMMGGEVKISDFNQKRLDNMCVKWIIKAEMPFRTVEQLDFKEFIHDLQPRYKIPNRRKIAKDVWSLFCEEKAKIKSIIGDLRVSITTDTWTSIQNINYMVVTAHFIDSDFHLHKRVLNFCKITSHKGEDIGRCLEEKLVEWGISKVFTVTVDNASSNDVAVEYLKKQLQKHDSDSLMLDENLHMRCACHIINLIVKDGMKELVDSIEAIRNCVKYIHSSSARLDKFREYAVLEKKDKMSTIQMDVVTRWNATYIMLHGAYKFKGVFARMVEEFTPFRTYFEDGRVGPPTDED